ncbi:MAG: carbohydrate ABC transporter permease [Acidilobaceae archaeon]|jgi:multiple sugar transport system permease protein
MRLAKHLRPLVFLAPPFTLIAVFVIYPILATFYYSFYDKNTGLLSLNNYKEVLLSSNPLNMIIARSFSHTPPWGALVHNLVWVALHVPIVTFLGLIIAYLLKYHVRGSTIIKAILFLGIVIPPAVGGLIIRFMFEADIGIVPILFSYVGVESLSKTWTLYPQTALLALILGSVWLWLGFSVTVFAAAMETIPRSHIEAAKVFGASTWQIFYRIVAPQLKPAITVVVVMTLLWDLKIFDIVYASTGGGPGGSTTVLALVMYNYFARALDYYKSAAVAVILTLVVIPFIVLIIRRERG